MENKKNSTTRFGNNSIAYDAQYCGLFCCRYFSARFSSANPMKRLIILGLGIMLLNGCATFRPRDSDSAEREREIIKKQTNQPTGGEWVWQLLYPLLYFAGGNK